MNFLHTYYSLRYGTLSPDKAVEMALEKGIHTLVVADINNSSAVLDVVKLCFESGIKPVAGMEFRKGNWHLFTVIAKNNAGFKELNDFLTCHNLEETELPEEPPVFNHCFVVYPFSIKREKLNENEFIGIRPEEVKMLLTSSYRALQDKLVIFNPVTFGKPEDFEIHRHLRAIDNNTLLSKLSPADLAPQTEVFLSEDEIKRAFAEYPQILRNTEKLIDTCSFSFEFKSNKNKRIFSGSMYEDKLLLQNLAMEGLEYRYGKNNKEAEARVKHELDIIEKLGFSSYFLITWDIICYSMSRGFYHVGRGSGANSVVAYCLKITDVDPIELDLYFERFINPKRTSPPDFDIDYSWKDRDEVIDYIFKKYGREHTALLGAITTFKGRSIIRELGKVYGLPKSEIDELVDNPKLVDTKDDISRNIARIGKLMSDFPNIRSIHAGGILISEEPITSYTALDLPPKGFPTTQWDMYVAEDIGFEKLDILSQRGIGHINESVEIIAKNRGVKIDVHEVEKFKNNPQIKYQLKTAETTGCFYIESPAMRGLLTKLRCDNYISLVAASSIIRPGVARSGMMREYIVRFHNPDQIKYLHPVMKDQLEETYGVMVYQEDVLKVCHHFAGLDLADADVLRRAMSGKHRSKNEFQRIVDKFFSNCHERGYPEEITKEVWRQIESFAGYSFSKAHSASYAVESFQSLFLKTYYPLEFMVAVINNFGGFYRTWVYVNEAKRQGANICLPCVNYSEYMTCITGKDIYLGFVHVSKLETKTAHALVDEKNANGPYADLEDFVNRVPVTKEQLVILIRTGAMRFTGIPKPRLLWEAHMLLDKRPPEERQQQLFRTKAKQFTLPELEKSNLEDGYDEIEFLEFPVSISYFDMLKTAFRGELFAKEMMNHVGKKVRMLGRLVTLKYVWTIHRELMNLGTFTDIHGEFFDSVHFPKALKEFPFRGSGIYLLLGTVTEDFGQPSLMVEKMAKMPLVADPRAG